MHAYVQKKRMGALSTLVNMVLWRLAEASSMKSVKAMVRTMMSSVYTATISR